MPSSDHPLEPESVEPDEALTTDDRVRQLGGENVVETPEMVNVYRWLDGKRLAHRCCRIVGESRTGKSVSCRTYAMQSGVTPRSGTAPLIPVLYWFCTEKLSVSGLFIGLLKALRYQVTNGRNIELRERLYRVLEGCQVEMIIFDEAQRITPSSMSEIRDIAEVLNISVVLVGTDRLNAVIQRDEQVLNRFMGHYRYPRLDAEGVREMSGQWEKHVLGMPESSNLMSTKVQSLLLPATRGYIGLLDEILRGAAIESIQRGDRRIEWETLKQYVQECSP